MFEADVDARRRHAEALFWGAGQDLIRVVAKTMATSCPRAVDYIDQAPVCVLLACTAFGGGVRAAGKSALSVPDPVRKRMAATVASVVGRGPKLRDLLEYLWVGRGMGMSRVSDVAPPAVYQFRALRAEALRQAHMRGIVALSRLSPSTLAQLIPRTSSRQDSFLRVVSMWADQFDHRVEWRMYPERYPGLVLAATRAIVAGNLKHSHDGAHLADFMCVHLASVATWSPARLLREVDDWTHEVKTAAAAINDDREVDYSPWPNDVTMSDDFDFVPLRSRSALVAESDVMRHCVHSYWGAVAGGASFIFSVRDKAGDHVATLEAARDDGRWLARQLKGVKNAPVAPKVAAEAQRFVHQMNLLRGPGLQPSDYFASSAAGR